MEDRVHGTVMPVLEITLQPDEAVFAESGELSWMTAGIGMQTSTQYGGGGGILRRAAGGGSLFMTEYRAHRVAGMVSFAAKLPGTIIPVDVAPEPGMGYLGHRHAFVCGQHGVELSFGFQQRLGAGVFGGNGFRLQQIAGRGRAWIELSGEVVSYDLRPGELMRVHPHHVGLFQDTVQFGITTVRGIKNKIFGGDGIFLAELAGPGRIWLQSLSISQLAHSLGEYAVAGAEGGAAAGAIGGLLRGFGG